MKQAVKDEDDLEAEEATKDIRIRDLPTYEENPFLSQVPVGRARKTEIIYDGHQAVINRDSGEVLEDQLAVARVKYVDNDQFVKIFLSNLNVFFELGKAAQRVCEFAMHQVATRALNRGDIIMSFPEYQSYFKGKEGGTRPTFMRGVQELAGKNLIAKTKTRDVWFINPAFMFNGDRAKFITELRRKKQSKAKIAEDHGQLQLIPRAEEAAE